MTFILQTYLAPLPDIVLKNYHNKIEPLQWQNKKIVFAPHCELVFNLVYRGFFIGFDILGALDQSFAKRGKFGNGLQAISYDDLANIMPDIVVVANNRYHKEIYSKLLAISTQHQFLLVDLCDGYSHREFRRQLAAELDCRNIAKLRPGCINVPERLDTDVEMKVEVIIETGWGLGDKICAMSAAREFARNNPNLKVYFNTLPKLVEAYNDDLLQLGRGAYPLPENYALFHREKDTSPAGNYLGSYYLGLGMDFDELPKIELPEVLLLPGLVSGKYIALQPTANWAKPSLTPEKIAEIIKRSPLPVVLTGSYVPVNSNELITNKDRNHYDEILIDAGADASYISDELAMLRIIRHAAIVITPRSATAHIASAYNINAVVLVPNDGENWHLDYPEWRHSRLPLNSNDIVEDIMAAITDLL